MSSSYLFELHSPLLGSPLCGGGDDNDTVTLTCGKTKGLCCFYGKGRITESIDWSLENPSRAMLCIWS